MQSKTIDIQTTSTTLDELLKLVQDAGGTEILLMRGNTPLARLIPAWERIPGLEPGSIWTSDDFDDPLPDDYI